MTLFRIFCFRVLSHIWIFLGQGIAYVSWHKECRVDLNKIQTITFYRADRIWDATVTVPFLKVFSAFLQKKWITHIKLEVIASQLNRFVFHDLEKTGWRISTVEKWDLEQYQTSLWRLISRHIAWAARSLFVTRGYREEKTHVLVDLMGDPYFLTADVRRKYIIAWPNLFFNTFLLDTSLPYSYVSLWSPHLIVSYAQIIDQLLGLSGEFSLFVEREWIDTAFSHRISSQKWTPKDVMVCVFNKEFRNLTPSTWQAIIEYLANLLPDTGIHVIDDQNGTILSQIHIDVAKYKNIAFIDNPGSLSGIRYLAQEHAFVVGTDGGAFNYVRDVTSSFTIYTLANPRVWSLYVPNAGVTMSEFRDQWKVEHKSLLSSQHVLTAYRDVWCLPSFELPLSRKEFNSFPLSSLNILASSFQ